MLLNLKFTKFTLIGIFNAISGYLLYLILIQFLSFHFAFIISYFVGIAISYFLNSYFVFQMDLSFLGYLQFVRTYLFLWLINYLLVFIFITYFHSDIRLTPIFISCILYPVSYRLLTGRNGG